MSLLGNSIGDSGAASLSHALAVNSSLTNLYWSGNSIGDSGATALSHVSTVNTTVRVDDLVLVDDDEEEEEEGDKDKEKHMKR